MTLLAACKGWDLFCLAKSAVEMRYMEEPRHICEVYTAKTVS